MQIHSFRVKFSRFSRASTGFLLLAVLSCSPKNEEVRTEQVYPAAPASTTDSGINHPKDGTATSQTNRKPKLLLPQPVLQLLSKKYPNWREPELLGTPEQENTEKDQGPLSVRGDFTGNTLQDMALQIRDKRDVVVVALLQDSANWQLHELKRDILFNDRGTYKSLYYVYLTPAGAQVYDPQSSQNIQTHTDGITIGIDNNATTYIFQNGTFKTYQSAER